jgi:hypothetical protein
MSIKDDIKDVLAGTGHDSSASIKEDIANVIAGTGHDSSTGVKDEFKGRRRRFERQRFHEHQR